MISAGPATRVFVALEPVDMRKGFDGLYGLVAHQLQEDPRSGVCAQPSTPSPACRASDILTG